MSASKITVYRSSPYVVEKNPGAAGEGEVAVQFDVLKTWLKNGKILRHLFRYDEAVMVTFDLKLIAKPFVTALILWSLARKKCVMRDDNGVAWEVGLKRLASLFSDMVKDSFGKKAFFEGLESQMKALHEEAPSSAARKLNLSERPVYLRTDLVFGLQAGGSVGHIAGVLNQLDQFSGKPVFLTTDVLPTVRKDLEAHKILPGDRFWDFSEMPSFYFNEAFYPEALKALGDRKNSFIYQRYSLNNFCGLKLARHYRVPFVLEYNGSEIWIGRNWGHPLKYESLSLKIEDVNLRESDLVVVVSQPMQEELVKRGVPAAKILVNPNGVEPEKYSPGIDGSAVKTKYGLAGKTVIGFIGTFGRWHGAELLAQAFGELVRKFPNYRETLRLFMIGEGVTLPQAREAVQKYGVGDLCTFTGAVPQTHGPAHLAACDILVSPTVPNPDGTPFFGSPTKLFEYMAMGKGIVASDLDQIGEILEHDKTAWLVKPGDLESLVSGLKALIDDEPRRLRLGEAARKEAVEKYTWKEHTRRIIEKLKERCP